ANIPRPLQFTTRPLLLMLSSAQRSQTRRLGVGGGTTARAAGSGIVLNGNRLDFSTKAKKPPGAKSGESDQNQNQIGSMDCPVAGISLRTQLTSENISQVQFSRQQ
ncbi:unnamed protein product, partial [Ceratitis capitata]